MADTELAIIGGGASAVLLLSALAKSPAAAGMRIDLYERDKSRLGRGIAYSTQHKVHLLNVRAANMSAYADDKDDFANWAAARNYNPLSFVPRRTYGEYLNEKLEEAKQKLSINIIESDVEAVRKIDREHFEITYNNRKREYKNVVLATGNVRPIIPKIDKDVQNYYVDPWSADFAALVRANHVGLIGSGLTAIDMVLALFAKGFAGKISVFSRHALPPAPHADPETLPPFIQENELPLSPYQVFRRLRVSVKKAGDAESWQAAVDSLRSSTNAIWDKWSKREREKFMKRLFTFWNVHRHRMAPEIHKTVQALVFAGRVEFIATPVNKVGVGPVISGNVDYKVDAVINCLGYRYREEGRNYDPTYKIGPANFGDLFETTAIPEIRMQAAEIAARILKNY